jgi:pimeloyl-ACP methyl ester carboxylesterase
MAGDAFVEILGSKLFLRRGGKGEPLLLLHGPQGFAGLESAMDGLRQQFDVLAPDHPGFGRSDAFESLDDVPDLAFFYLDLLTALDLKRVHVVGHSLGGWVALEMAVRSTARIGSLTLAAAAGIRVPGVPRADMFICTPDELARLLFAGEGWKGWHAQLQATPEQQEQFDRNRFQAAKLCWQPRLFDPKLEKWLHRIDRPTRIVWGAEDKVIPAAYGARLKELIPGASLAVMPGAGHMLPVERPQDFVAEAQRFLQGIAA